MTLDVLPQELVDMVVFDNRLDASDLNKIRQLSRSHNHRFQHINWAFLFPSREIRILLTEDSLLRLYRIVENACDDLKSYIPHVFIDPIEPPEPEEACANHKEPPDPREVQKIIRALKHPRVKSLITKLMKALTHLRTIEFNLWDDFIGVGIQWKLVMDAIVTAKRGTLETLRTPRNKFPMSSLSPPRQQLALQQSLFANLKSLLVTTAVRTAYERVTVTMEFWNWISVIGGNNLEELVVIGFRGESFAKPVPNAEGRFLPKSFNLPKLKHLELTDVCVTFKDLNVILRKGNIRHLESIRIAERVAEVNRPAFFFKLLKRLQKYGARRLRNLELPLGGTHNNVVAYELPNLCFEDNWSSPKTETRVEVNMH
ncbi:hypothetical protein TWF481_011577 [Arthrobotrys musiformis]|uniref:F-box domain-containing protein n=1 Tax=Arthrobotrys musiformis TaxID=47236 RepID=A0AAV9W0U5_9PEZI